MKNKILILASILTVFASACTFSTADNNSQSVGFTKGAKVSSSGLTTINDGLTFKESYFTADGAKVESNEVKIGQKVAIVIEGIEGFQVKNGKVFPLLSILVVDANGKVVVTFDDLLKAEQGYDVKDATTLTGALTVGEPLKAGEKYQLTLTVADKDGKGSIIGNINLKVK